MFSSRALTLPTVFTQTPFARVIESGTFTPITELPEAESVNQSYAWRILRLTLLAPNIVTEILDGQYPSDLMLKRVMRPLPIRWDEQRAVLKAVPQQATH